ncbi:methyltransferase [Methylocystis sp. Sn-Cys]|uniref:methyltransferase n=1 Tax=Methylocystis sp. Sn-Cys TaxID=1701263 RepID=UPI001924D70D|nr:methyltransferase [Methylocystis sp. Sn-Cys]MBL1258296.1 methyltransferase [Methylocystis sp. Sn-Cys]
MTVRPSPEKLLALGMSFWNAKALLSAVELGVFDALAEGPADLESLRTRLGLHERSARDFFDALVALKLLERQDGDYRNAPDADFFLVRARPSYVGGLLEMANARLYESWGHLTEALRTGRRQSENKEESDFFAALYADPARLRGFLAAMSGVSAGAANAIAGKFPWRNYKSFVDVGVAQGMVPVTIARAHPHLSGGGFDLPPVGPIFEEFVAANGLSERLQFHAGDFFKDALPQTDVIIMGHILHDWDLEQKRLLVKKAYDALPAGGALIVYEALIDDDRRQNAFGLLMSLNMLIETLGGFDYTGADCQGWMKEAGFSETRVEHLVGPDSMVVGIKQAE